MNTEQQKPVAWKLHHSIDETRVILCEDEKSMLNYVAHGEWIVARSFYEAHS